MLSRSKRYLVGLLASIAICNTAVAQNASRVYVEPNGWSIGTNVGMTDLWGDVGTKSFIDHYSNSKYFDRVAFMGGMFGRYRIHPCFAVRLMFSYGSVYATDKWNYDKALLATNQGEDAFQRYARNQNAKATIFENTVLLEFTPFRCNPEAKSAYRRGQLFFAAGLSYFHFEPYSTIANTTTWTKTYDLHLEGQGFRGDGYPANYNRWALGIPLGIGYRWDLGEHLNLGLEYIYRMTFTDYLDGVSDKYVSNQAFKQNLAQKEAALAMQVADKGYYLGLEPPNAPGNMRGNPGNKDGYSSLNITFYYKVVAATHQWWRHSRTNYR